MSRDPNKIVENVAKDLLKEKEASQPVASKLKRPQTFSERRRQAKFEQMKKNPEMVQARQELKEEFLSTHPRFTEMSDQQLQEEMQKHATEEEKVRKQKLRSHMETFSDGVIAVIITIMLLEIPVPKNGDNYWTFLSAVGVFLISFIVIANFWFNHHKIFAVTEEITEETIVQDFAFMGLLSIVPLLTKWIIAEPNWFSSMNYGIVIFLILVQQAMISYGITRDHFRRMPKSFKFWRRIWLSRLFFTLAVNIVITGIAVAFPVYGHWLFVVVPVFNFLSQLFERDQAHEWQNPEDEEKVGVPYLK